jgi:predicted transcriptional regulator
MNTKELINLSPEVLLASLKRYIIKYKLKQIDIANVLGVAPGTLSRYLNNKRYPSRHQAEKIREMIKELMEIENGNIDS